MSTVSATRLRGSSLVSTVSTSTTVSNNKIPKYEIIKSDNSSLCVYLHKCGEASSETVTRLSGVHIFYNKVDKQVTEVICVTSNDTKQIDYSAISCKNIEKMGFLIELAGKLDGRIKRIAASRTDAGLFSAQSSGASTPTDAVLNSGTRSRRSSVGVKEHLQTPACDETPVPVGAIHANGQAVVEDPASTAVSAVIDSQAATTEHDNQASQADQAASSSENHASPAVSAVIDSQAATTEHVKPLPLANSQDPLEVSDEVVASQADQAASSSENHASPAVSAVVASQAQAAPTEHDNQASQAALTALGVHDALDAQLLAHRTEPTETSPLQPKQEEAEKSCCPCSMM